MLFVERSNRTELLFDGLAGRLGAPGRDPLARAVVVVQGAGMERWLAQGLARRHGVCANVEFPFPRPFLERVFAAIESAEGAATPAPWDLDRMTWAIAKRIDADRAEADYAPLRRHLDAVDGDWRLIQLAHRIADVFDQYVTYRPDWIRSWEDPGARPIVPVEGPDARWQIRLFRALEAELGPGHIAYRAGGFLDRVGMASSPRPGKAPASRAARAELEAALRRSFPDVIEIFAVSTLPPLHLAVVRGLATVLDVRLSILAPSRAWYSDLWRELRDTDGAAASPVAALLSGLGRLGADFQQTLLEVATPDGGERDLFELPDSGRADASLLARLQARILDLDEGEVAPAARRVAREDDSIRVHLCHGPRRELEVVEGILRAAFERDPTLVPEDVIVMAPDIDAIAADIEAVFGAGAEDRGGIPYRIADRGTYRRSPVAEAFRALLALLGTRMARSVVFDWLAKTDVAGRFGLDEAGVEALADWADRAGYRFGLDEIQRTALALPAERGHTLAGTLDRLILAHALGETDDVAGGISPIALDAFAEAAWIGALGEVESLLQWAVEGTRPTRSVADWTHWLASLLSRSVARSDANSHEHAAILAVLERLRASALATGFDRALPFEAIRERVVAVLEQTPSPQAFLAGGVTFCQLVPLRAIPFRLVVVTGLVDGEFPRSRAAQGFDWMAKVPRAGDRRLRDDDRHLFLEAILSAREQLVLTVPAHDLRSGEARPASIVVSELLDALAGSFTLDADGSPDEGSAGQVTHPPGALREWLVVTHPLQATSPRYFEVDRDRRLASRSERAYRGALARSRAAEAGGRVARRFLVPLDPASRGSDPSLASGEPIELDDLIERVVGSTRHFSRNALGLRLPRPESVAGDLDPIELSPLEKAALGRAFFADLERGEAWQRATRRMHANPLLPAGLQGERVARPLVAEARAIAAIAADLRAGERLPDLAFELEIPSSKGDSKSDSKGSSRGNSRDDSRGRAPRSLVGRLDSLWSQARIEVGFGRIGERSEAALWIRHLVLCALVRRGASLPAASFGVGRSRKKNGEDDGDHVVRLARIDDPLPLLARLVEWAESVDVAPLPFFVRSSRQFAERCFDEDSIPARAWRDARGLFEGRDDADRRQPEGEQELETVRVWEGRSPIAPADELGLPFGFDELALEFFEPLLRARSVSSA